MYKIIGADGKEYGPVAFEKLRQWIAEGRANAQTRVLPEGATEWKTLAEVPELAAHLPGIAGTASSALPPGPPPSLGSLGPTPTPMSSFGGDPAGQVSGPAIGLIVVAVLNFLSAAGSFAMPLFTAGLANMPNMPQQQFSMFFSTGAIVVSSIISLAVGVLILVGALKMKKLESHGLAVTASILAALPCTSGCCIIGLPVGIWALVILFRPEVKNAFR
jgi:hypothetical protein